MPHFLQSLKLPRWGQFLFSRILSDGEFQLPDPRSAKTLDKVVEEVQKCRSLGAAEKHLSAKICTLL